MASSIFRRHNLPPLHYLLKDLLYVDVRCKRMTNGAQHVDLEMTRLKEKAEQCNEQKLQIQKIKYSKYRQGGKTKIRIHTPSI